MLQMWVLASVQRELLVEPWKESNQSLYKSYLTATMLQKWVLASVQRELWYKR